MREEIEKYVRSLGLDAYLVGGAVRDELLGLDSKDADFLVPGLDTEGLRSALAPHGRVEDLVVADRLVGIRLHPRDRRDPEADACRDRVRASAQGGLHRARTARLRDRRRPLAVGGGRHAPPRLHRQRDGPPARDGRSRRPARRPGRPRGAPPAHGLAAELPRGSAAARPRAPLRLAARLRAG